MKARQVTRRRPPSLPAEPAAAAALPATRSTEDHAAGSGVLILFAALFGFGMLLLAASALPPRRIPSRALAESLLFHRSDLLAFGVGAIALAFLFLNIAVLL